LTWARTAALLTVIENAQRVAIKNCFFFLICSSLAG
jgi:hypothetical protein